MYTAAINAIVFMESIKVLLIGIGWFSAVGCAILWVVWGCKTECNCWNPNYSFKGIMLAFTIFVTCIWPACITIYNLPLLNRDIVIAKQVAAQMDIYAEAHPDSIYTPEVLLGSVDTVIKGIVSTSVNLPEYIKKLANGEIVQFVTGPKDPKDMTATEMQAEILRLRAGK
jgi:hypothetical protein